MGAIAILSEAFMAMYRSADSNSYVVEIAHTINPHVIESWLDEGRVNCNRTYNTNGVKLSGMVHRFEFEDAAEACHFHMRWG